jgi:hypothetical protein
VDGAFGFGVEEIAFSARGMGVAVCPKTACPSSKLLAMRADNWRKGMEFEKTSAKTSVYLAEQSGNASNPRLLGSQGAEVGRANE